MKVIRCFRHLWSSCIQWGSSCDPVKYWKVWESDCSGKSSYFLVVAELLCGGISFLQYCIPLLPLQRSRLWDQQKMVWQWKYSWQSCLGLLLDKDSLYEIRKSGVSIIIIHWQQAARPLMVFTRMVVLTHRLVTLNNHKERKELRALISQWQLFCAQTVLCLRKLKSRWERVSPNLSRHKMV